MVEHTRTLDFKIAFALGLGTMIAAGIFSLSGTAVLRIGSTAVVAFVLAAVVAGITAAAYSEFASIYAENGGVLLVGASRDRRLRQWVFGSTPDRIIDLASAPDREPVPVVVYARTTSLRRGLEDYLFPVYKFLRRLGRTTDTRRSEQSTATSARSTDE